MSQFGTPQNFLTVDFSSPDAFAELMRRRFQPTSTPADKPKKVPVPSSAKSVSVPPPTTPPAVNPPAPVPTAPVQSITDPNSYGRLREGAKMQYEAELAALKDRESRSAGTAPIAYKRAGERYQNALRGIDARERMDRRRTRGDELRAKRATTAAPTRTPAAPVQTTTASSASALSRVANPTQTAPDVKALVQDTTAGRIGQIAETPTDSSGFVGPPSNPEDYFVGPPAPTPAPVQYDLDSGVRTVLENAYRGRIQPGNVGIDNFVSRLQGSTDQQLRDLFSGLRALPHEEQRRMLRGMTGDTFPELRERAGGVGAVPEVGFLQRLQESANSLAQDFTNATQNPVLQTLAGPGGLVGPQLPEDAVAYELARARTPEEARAIQARAAQARMQGALLDALGIYGVSGGARAAPNMRAPQTRVIDNPMIRGQTPSTFYGPGTAGRNAIDVTQGSLGLPVTINPGNPGQIMDMPVPQAMPGVMPRDLPTSSGAMQRPRLQLLPQGQPVYRPGMPLSEMSLRNMMENPGLTIGSVRRRPTPLEELANPQ